MDFNKIFQSKIFKWVLIAIGTLIVAMLVFKLGVFVGYKKAGFSYGWGKFYHQNFAGPRRGFMREKPWGIPPPDRDFINPNGTAGTILKIDAGEVAGQFALTVKGQDNVEKIILVSDKTTIRKRAENITAADLKADENVVIIGTPNDKGQIEAKLIRIF